MVATTLFTRLISTLLQHSDNLVFEAVTNLSQPIVTNLNYLLA